MHKGRGGSDSQHFVQLLRKSMAKAAPARTSAGREASAAAAPVTSSSTSTEAHARLKRRGCCWCVLLGGRELGPRRGVGAAGRGIRTRSGRAGSCGRERGGPGGSVSAIAKTTSKSSSARLDACRPSERRWGRAHGPGGAGCAVALLVRGLSQAAGLLLLPGGCPLPLARACVRARPRPRLRPRPLHRRREIRPRLSPPPRPLDRGPLEGFKYARTASPPRPPDDPGDPPSPLAVPLRPLFPALSLSTGTISSLFTRPSNASRSIS